MTGRRLPPSRSLIYLLALTLARTAAAVEPPCHARPDAHYADVTVRGDTETSELVRAELAELFGRRGLVLRVIFADTEADPATSPASGAEVAVRATIALRADGARVLVGAADGASAVTSRDIPASGSRAVLAAEVAEVVHSATDTLCDATPARPPLPLPAEPAPPPPSPIASPPLPQTVAQADWQQAPTVTMSMALGGIVQAFADQPAIAGGIGGRLGLQFSRLLPSPNVGMTGYYFFPVQATANGASATIERTALRMFAGVTALRASWFGLAVLAGPGVDILHVHPTGLSFLVVPNGDVTGVSPILTGEIAARAEVRNGTYIELAARLDGDLMPLRYVVATPNGPAPVSVPLSVRPGLSLGLAFDVAVARK